jgi:hypothetical protein
MRFCRWRSNPATEETLDCFVAAKIAAPRNDN